MLDKTALSKISEAARTQGEDIWLRRLKRAARHILAATVFKENSSEVARETESFLLPPIGLYYSVFHAGVAIASCDPGVAPTALNRVGHGALERILTGSPMMRGLVRRDFINALRTLKKFREYANYEFGYRDVGMPFRDDFPRLASLADVALVHAADIVSKVSTEASAAIGLSDQVPTLIGDNFGDDLIRGYLTREQKERVVQRLLEFRLTT